MFETSGNRRIKYDKSRKNNFISNVNHVKIRNQCFSDTFLDDYNRIFTSNQQVSLRI